MQTAPLDDSSAIQLLETHVQCMFPVLFSSLVLKLQMLLMHSINLVIGQYKKKSTHLQKNQFHSILEIE